MENEKKKQMTLGKRLTSVINLNKLKVALSGLEQLLATGGPLKIVKNALYFTLGLFALKTRSDLMTHDSYLMILVEVFTNHNHYTAFKLSCN